MTEFQRDTEVENIHIPKDELDDTQLVYKSGIRIDYINKRGTEKSIEGLQPTHPTSFDEIEGGVVFWSQNEQKYNFNKETLTLSKRKDKEWVEVASGDSVFGIYILKFPSSAPVVGDIQEDVVIRVHYITNFGNERHTDISVDYIDGNRGNMIISGNKVSNGKSVELNTYYHRKIETYKRKIGTVTRVEFPLGEEFNLEIKNKTGIDTSRIEKALRSEFKRSDDIEIEVSKEGVIEFE